jgi:hypothetical protein
MQQALEQSRATAGKLRFLPVQQAIKLCKQKNNFARNYDSKKQL